MSADLILLIDSLIPPLGWTIVHSLWQGCVFAVPLAALLRAMRAAPPGPRYVVCCAALVLMVAAAVFTFVVLHRRTAGPIEDAAPAALVAPVPKSVSVDVVETAATIAAPAPQEPELQPLRYVVIAWLIGVAALSLWHVGGWMWLQSMRRGPVVRAWQAAVDRLSGTLRIGRAVRLVESLHIDVPAVVGIVRPVILVPVGILNDLSAQQVEAILAHELAHVRRHDYLVNLLQAAVETLMFYHPATWWISRRIREERENCCDDVATTVCGDATVYASALAALEERRMPQLKLAPAATGGALLDRVRRILRLPPPPTRRTSRIRSLAAAAVAIACVAVPLVVNSRRSNAADKADLTIAATHATTTAATATTTQPTSPIRPEDLRVEIRDYRIGPGDLLSTSIADLVAAGVETVKAGRVSESGIVSLPLVGEIKVSGLTEHQAERAVQQAYREKNLIENAQVAITVQEARGQTFSIVGGVESPGQYQIVQPDFRVLDALAVARGRPSELTALRLVRRPAEGENERRVIEIPLGRLVAGDVEVNIVIRRGDTLIALGREKREPEFLKIVVGKESLLHDGKPMEWADLEKKFEAMDAARRSATVLEVAAAAPDVTVERFFNASARLSDLVKKYGLAHLSQTGIQPTTEPAAMLPAGTEVGEYYMDGAVPRTGVYSLTARKISLKQAIVAAGGLENDVEDALITVIRRDADDKESVPLKDVRLSDILNGKAKDLFLKPNDIVRVQPDPEPAKSTALADLRAKREALEQELAVLMRTHGDRHVNVLDVKRMLEAVNQEIEILSAAAPSATTAPAPDRPPAAPADKPEGADAGLENGYAKLVELARMRDQLEVGRSACLSLGEQHPDRIKYQMMMDTMDQKIEKHLEAHPQLIGTPLASIATTPSTPAAAADEVLSPHLLAEVTRLAESDPVMAGYLRARAQLLMQSDQYDALGEQHPDRIRFRAMLASANKRIRHYYKEVSQKLTPATTQP